MPICHVSDPFLIHSCPTKKNEASRSLQMEPNLGILAWMKSGFLDHEPSTVTRQLHRHGVHALALHLHFLGTTIMPRLPKEFILVIYTLGVKDYKKNGL